MKKKIAIVLPKLNAGGNERTAASLANYLSAKGIDVTILLMYSQEIFFELSSDVKIIEPENQRNFIGKYLYIPYLLFFLRKHLKKGDFDTIFCIGYILFGLISSLNLKSRVIISKRCNPDKDRFPSNTLATKIYDFSHYLLRKRVDGFIAQTNYAKEVYERKYNCPIVVIPNFIRDVNPSNNKIRSKTIITMGRLVYEKGQHLLLKAFAIIEDKGDWQLQIIGDGPLENELKKMTINLGISEKVHFLGFQKDVDYYLSHAEIFAFTSISEGYPNALLEGMANGLAPISYNCVAGPSDIITDNYNGFLIPLKNISLFSKKLKELMQNKTLRSNFQKEALKIKLTNNMVKIGKEYENFLFLENKKN